MAVEKLEYVDEKVLHSFAKRLANNEPRLRKIALKKLKGWMEIRAGNMKCICSEAALFTSVKFDAYSHIGISQCAN